MGRFAAGIILIPGDISDHTVGPELTVDSRETTGVRDKRCDSKKHHGQLRR